MGDELYFDELVNSTLKFTKYGRVKNFIFVGDFYIRTTYSGKDYEDSIISEKWRTFMYDQFGSAYAVQFISQRNQQLDKFMADYEEKYNAQTRNMLDKMGFNYGKTK